MKWARIGGYGGAAIGMLGWLIGLAVVSAKAGTPEVASLVMPAGVALTLALWALLVVCLESVMRRFGAVGPWFHTALWGLLTTYMGLMVLLANHWVAPLIDRTPRLAQLLSDPQSVYYSVYQTSDTLPLALLGAGAVLLGALAWRMMLGDERV